MGALEIDVLEVPITWNLAMCLRAGIIYSIATKCTLSYLAAEDPIGVWNIHVHSFQNTPKYCVVSVMEQPG